MPILDMSTVFYLWIAMGLFSLAGLLLSDVLLMAGQSMAQKLFEDTTSTFATIRLKVNHLSYYLWAWEVTMLIVLLGVGGILQKWVLALTVIFIIFQIPRFVLNKMINRQKRRLRDQLVEVLPILVNSVRAGLSLEEALSALCDNSPVPLRDEFVRIHHDYIHGRPLVHALDDAKKRLKVECFTVFATALITTIVQGGNLSSVLDKMHKNLEENQRLERNLEAKTASGSLTVLVLAVFPAGYFFFSLWTNFEGTQFFLTNFIGNILLSISILLCYTGFRWGNAILNIEF